MKPLLCLVALCLASCQGPDPVRLRAEETGYQLAARCADGWFLGLPFTPHDEKLVRDSLADWRRALDADAALLAAPTVPEGGGR
jgi:alkanesulfonate monooxygenase SsuD/methylene tetrahydromethanopterin reductase-like flavin-dependent oxidoreductase (luciferase family)